MYWIPSKNSLLLYISLEQAALHHSKSLHMYLQHSALHKHFHLSPVTSLSNRDDRMNCRAIRRSSLFSVMVSFAFSFLVSSKKLM